MTCDIARSEIDLLLALDFMLRQPHADVVSNKIVPFELTGGAPAHCVLPSPQLRDGLQLLDRDDSFLEELDVRVTLGRLVADRLE